MFRKPTVFVIGAGASFDKYGLPLGGTLAANIAADTNFLFENFSSTPIRGDKDLFDRVIFQKFRNQRELFNRYTDAGHRLSAALSSAVSVDDALYQLSEFPEAVELGKICIIRSILKAESQSTLRVNPEVGTLLPAAGKDGWIEQIFSMAIAGYKLSEIHEAFTRVTFVNFNYDRCIEHYLYWALQRIGLKEHVAINIVENLNFIRPYGTLGSIIAGNKTFLPFGSSQRCDYLSMTKRIRTFTESDVLHDRQTLSDTISAADTIIFLGFGYHPQNLELMQQPPGSLQRKMVLATMFGINVENQPDLTMALHKTLYVDPSDIRLFVMSASDILRQLRPKIQLRIN